MRLNDFLGGSPLVVVVRLLLLSLIVGLVLSIFGITPRNFFHAIDDFFRLIYDMGFETVEWMIKYIMLGAMLVVPIWFVLRLFRARPHQPPSDEQ